MYGIRAYEDEQLVFACTLFVMMRPNGPCLRVRYSCGCVRIDRVGMYGIRAYDDE